MQTISLNLVEKGFGDGCYYACVVLIGRVK